MAYFYTYLISTLPTLSFGLRPPFSFEKFIPLEKTTDFNPARDKSLNGDRERSSLTGFIDYCRRFIPQEDGRILEKVSLFCAPKKEVHPALKKWREFDTALRNELVKARAARRHLDPIKYLRQDSSCEHSIAHIALSAARSTSILEAERILDQERWRMLDEFSFGHYFDLDFLILYALKLLLLERWERINTQDKAQILEEALKLN